MTKFFYFNKRFNIKKRVPQRLYLCGKYKCRLHLQKITGTACKNNYNEGTNFVEQTETPIGVTVT